MNTILSFLMGNKKVIFALAITAVGIFGMAQTAFAAPCVLERIQFGQTQCYNDPSSSQVCVNPPAVQFDLAAATTNLYVNYDTNGVGHCSNVAVRIWLDDVLMASTGFVPPDASSGYINLGPAAAGHHIINFQGIGQTGGCNVGTLKTWGGFAVIGLPAGQCTTTTTTATAQCSDNIDNDGDGAMDYPSDFSCSSATDTDESNPKAACQDGLDNDGDNLTDLFDPGCFGRQDNDESNASTATITCSSNTQCPQTSATQNYCNGNNVYNTTTSYTCMNAGTASSYCQGNTNQQFVQACASGQTCSGAGVCTTITTTCTSHASQRCAGNNAVYWFDSCGNQQELYQACQGNQTCSNNSCVTVTTGNNLTSTKQGRNLSSGNLTWSTNTSAAPSDILQFQITVKNNGSQLINNVVVKDTFPVNLNYYNNLTLDGVANSGNIISGLNIGSIAAGQTKLIAYQAQVAPVQNFGFGTTTLTNSVTITSSEGTNSASGSGATISVNRTSGATGAPTGWTDNIFFDSFFLPLALALAGVWAWKSGLLGALGFAGVQNRIANNKLAAKISEIRQREQA